MKALMKLFQSQLDKYSNTQYYIDCKFPPQRLLRELKLNQGKKLVKLMESTTTNPFKIIRMMSVVNLVLMHTKCWFQLIETHLKLRLTKDDWINTKFLEPYYRFIIKCCTSKETYNESKAVTPNKQEAFQMLFYSINMLRQLFKVVQKMPLIGRYYKTKNNSVISSAIEIIALQAQKLYGCFKLYLCEMLNHPLAYIKSKQDETIFRGILLDQLNEINQEMKKLFLDKYFYPLGKGIGVKLFRIGEQSQECQKFMKAIISNHEDTERQRRHEELEQTLFPGSGLVNWNFFQETLLAGPLSVSNLNASVPSNFVALDDLVISEQQEEVVEEIRQSTNKKAQSQKQTNSGTLQIKGRQL